MSRAFTAAILGIIVTWIVYLLGRIPTTGPNVVVLICVMPFQILSSLVAKHEPITDIVYFGMQICFWSVVWFVILSIIKRLRR